MARAGLGSKGRWAGPRAQRGPLKPLIMASGLEWTGPADWASGLGQWTGPVDWASGLGRWAWPVGLVGLWAWLASGLDWPVGLIWSVLAGAALAPERTEDRRTGLANRSALLT